MADWWQVSRCSWKVCLMDCLTCTLLTEIANVKVRSFSQLRRQNHVHQPTSGLHHQWNKSRLVLTCRTHLLPVSRSKLQKKNSIGCQASWTQTNRSCQRKVWNRSRLSSENNHCLQVWFFNTSSFVHVIATVLLQLVIVRAVKLITLPY